MVADTMVKYARNLIEARAHPHIDVKPVTTGASDQGVYS